MITLVGTVHEDLAGPERLRKIIAHYRPQIIAVEACANIGFEERMREQGLEISRAWRDRLVALYSDIRPEVGKFIADYFGSAIGNYAYEVAIARQYQAAKRIRIVYLGDKNLRERRLEVANNQIVAVMRQFEEFGKEILSDPEKLNDIRRMPEQEIKQGLTNVLLAGIEDAYRADVGSVIGDEELFMEDSLWSDSIRRMPKGASIMPVVGAYHTKPFKGTRYSTLATLIQDLEPHTVLLPEADGLTA